jgi:S1-C subfamily serine protease
VDLLDIVLIVLVAAAGIHGLRLGAAIQVLTFIGFLLGLAAGVALVVTIDPHVSGQLARTVVALVLLFIPASLLAGAGRQLGVHLFHVLHHARLGAPDALLGAAVAVVATLISCWLVASVLVNSQFSLASREIEHSKILQTVSRVMPPVPDAFSSVERFLNVHGFPEVFANLVPEQVGPVALPDRTQVAAAIAADGRSTVKIVAFGCGDEFEGSGIVVAPNLVITNAHVIAGTEHITVEDSSGSHIATPIFFDPRFDLAVLETAPLDEPILHLDPNLVGRGTDATVLGYPGGGPFDAQPAGVLERFVAQGRDIYDQGLTVRTVYELKAVVRPGNSGGPLVAANGEVIGIVFSRSASNGDIGYALASPGVLRRLDQARAHEVPTSTEACMN